MIRRWVGWRPRCLLGIHTELFHEKALAHDKHIDTEECPRHFQLFAYDHQGRKGPGHSAVSEGGKNGNGIDTAPSQPGSVLLTDPLWGWNRRKPSGSRKALLPPGGVFIQLPTGGDKPLYLALYAVEITPPAWQPYRQCWYNRRCWECPVHRRRYRNSRCCEVSTPASGPELPHR